MRSLISPSLPLAIILLLFWHRTHFSDKLVAGIVGLYLVVTIQHDNQLNSSAPSKKDYIYNEDCLHW
jgi:hypothetical protein